MVEQRLAPRMFFLALAVAPLAAAESAAESAAGKAGTGLAALAGERLEYRVRWGVLSVAVAVLGAALLGFGFA